MIAWARCRRSKQRGRAGVAGGSVRTCAARSSRRPREGGGTGGTRHSCAGPPGTRQTARTAAAPPLHRDTCTHSTRGTWPELTCEPAQHQQRLRHEVDGEAVPREVDPLVPVQLPGGAHQPAVGGHHQLLIVEQQLLHCLCNNPVIIHVSDYYRLSYKPNMIKVCSVDMFINAGVVLNYSISGLHQQHHSQHLTTTALISQG